jgi:hypothetical protein
MISRGSSDATHSEQIQELRSELASKAEDLEFGALGLGLQSLNALGVGPESACSHAVLEAVGRSVVMLSMAGDLGRTLSVRNSARSSSGGETIMALSWLIAAVGGETAVTDGV